MPLDICIVEDYSTISTLHSALFNFFGLKNQIDIFNTCDLALTHLDTIAANKDCHNLLILDLDLSTRDVWELLDKLQNRSYRNKLYIVLCTSSEGKDFLEKIKSYSQVIGFLTKPINVFKIDSLLSMRIFKGLIEE